MARQQKEKSDEEEDAIRTFLRSPHSQNKRSEKSKILRKMAT